MAVSKKKKANGFKRPAIKKTQEVKPVEKAQAAVATANAETIQTKTNEEWNDVSKRNVANRNRTMVNTAQGYKETPESANVQPETPVAEPAQVNTTDCLQVRSNGETCLQEYERAKSEPRTFSEPQLNAIQAGRNLCVNCKNEVKAELAK